MYLRYVKYSTVLWMFYAENYCTLSSVKTTE